MSSSAQQGTAIDQQSGMLYNAACAYSLCGMLVTKEKPEPSEAELADRKKYLELALTCLKESIAAGWDDLEHMRQDTDLQPLHGVPEFEELFPKDAGK